MASSEKTESVNAVEIKHLTKLFETLSNSIDQKLDKVFTLLDKYKEDTKQRQDDTDYIAKDFANKLANLTSKIEATQKADSKRDEGIAHNKEKINQLEKERISDNKEYVSRRYFHSWLLSIAILVIGSMSWQDLQTQRYFDELEYTISLSQHEKKELEQYKKLNQHLLTPEVLEIIRHYKEAKKGM